MPAACPRPTPRHPADPLVTPTRRRRHRPRRHARLATASPASPAAGSARSGAARPRPARDRRRVRRSGSGCGARPDLTIDLDAHRRPRPADRGGRPPGRLGRPLRDPPRARPRGRRGSTIHVDGLRYQPGDLPGDAAAGPRRGHDRRPRRERHGRRLMRTAPDGPQGLRRRRPARGVPRGRRQPRGARRRDQRAERLPGPRRRHRHRTCSRPSGPRSTRPRASAAMHRRSGSPAAISFGALMGARGNSGVITSQILRGHGRGARPARRRFNGLDLANALHARARRPPTARSRKPVEGTILTVIREASAAAVAAAEQDERHRDRPGGDGRGGRASPSRRRRRSCRSCARPASSTPAGRACSGSSRARS